MNPVKTLTTLGQSVWLDYIRRGMLNDGEFERLLSEDGVSGVTSNPAIFQKAIAGSGDYADAISILANEHGLETESIYEHLAIEDVRHAADLLRPVYDETDAGDGYVSLEVSPLLARDTQGTLAAARRLWQAVDRPNLMIKIPATPEGLEAFEDVLAEGINVNITLLFSVPVYQQVAERYLSGMERRLAAGHSLKDTASVASFFLSRIDNSVDKLIDQRLTEDPADQEILASVRGRSAVSSARIAYQKWKTLFSGPRWQALEDAGAHPQRLLWASTSTKDPDFSDLLYVESLIGPHTVNTIPPVTLDALRDHGRPSLALEDDIDGANKTLATLHTLEIDLERITDELLNAGVESFDAAYYALLDAVDAARTRALGAA